MLFTGLQPATTEKGISMRRTAGLAALLVCFSFVSAHASTFTYYTSGFDDFGVINVTTGATFIIGVGTVPGNTGIDVTPAGNAYEYNFTNQLMQINTRTGATTLVGAGNIPDVFTSGGLANGSYFDISLSNNLYSINLATGATTLIGFTGIAPPDGSCSVNTSLSGNATTLFLHRTIS
jgi:hypothetical protein